MVSGYKVFNKGIINKYGVSFEEKKAYRLDISKHDVKYGKYGYHFTKRLEDGLRYFDGLNEDLVIAKVKSLGNVLESYDDYYEYYNLYVTDYLYIDYMINTTFPRLERFIQGYKLTESEIAYLTNYDLDKSVQKAIEYYQYGNKDAYVKSRRF